LHADAASCYSVVNGSVYDLTNWITKHPGGQQAIKGLCGKDGTAAFTGKHGGQQKPETMLASFKIGVLAQ
jgi:cytochrome b involved in lipid metabolism